MKKVKRTIAVFDRRQYYMADALSDLRTAAVRNEDVFFLSIVAVLAVSYAVLHTAATYLYVVLQTAYEVATLTGINMIALILIVIGILITLCGWIAAFLMNNFSLALYDGATRKKYSSIRRTVRTGLRHSGRVASVWLLLLLAISMPMLLASVVAILVMRSFGTSLAAATSALPYAAAITGTWILFILTRYALVPKVTLLEPTLGVYPAFARSRQLLRRKGRLTVVILSIMTAALCLLTYSTALFANNAIEGLGSLVVFIGAVAGSLLLNGTLTMLYCKSKRARKV